MKLHRCVETTSNPHKNVVSIGNSETMTISPPGVEHSIGTTAARAVHYLPNEAAYRRSLNFYAAASSDLVTASSAATNAGDPIAGEAK